MSSKYIQHAERLRLEREARRDPGENWKRWGPYLSERQWGTVREDYSHNGQPWDYFQHDDARGRAYRWGEDGLLGICDRQCRLCFALALWNEHDPILKERLFGVGGPEGNHGEDVKEFYFYLDSTPTHSYMKGLYKYPQGEFPYEQLALENRNRGQHLPEYELGDTGIFDENRYFDVQAEYAKESANNILIQLTISNRGPEAAPIHILPTLWFRNTWTWGCEHEGCWARPRMWLNGDGHVSCEHETLGKFNFAADSASDGSDANLDLHGQRFQSSIPARSVSGWKILEGRISQLRRQQKEEGGQSEEDRNEVGGSLLREDSRGRRSCHQTASVG